MAQKFASVERRILHYIQKKYAPPLSLSEHLTKTSVVPSQLDLKRAKEESRMFQILSALPNFGIGRLMVDINDRHPWEDNMGHDGPSFWRITGVHVDHTKEQLDYGIAFGIYTDKGYCTGYQQEIPKVNQHKWRLVPRIMEDKYLNYEVKQPDSKELPLYVKYPPLLDSMLKAEQIKKGVEKSEVKTPMLKLMYERNPYENAQQKLEDGTLV